jgi:uncharacterized membrane protein
MIFSLFFILILVVLVILLCTPKAELGLASGTLLVLGLGVWLAVETNLPVLLSRILGDIVELGWENREQLLMALAASIILIVPMVLMYVVICEQIDNHAIRKEFRESNGIVRDRFNQRVRKLMALGYDRQRAVATTRRVLRRKRSRSPLIF